MYDYVCVACLRTLLALELPRGQAHHRCPACRTAIVPDAGTWVAAVDERGSTFFQHSQTGERVSRRPRGCAPHWERVHDKGNDGGDSDEDALLLRMPGMTHYYYNRMTGEKTWERPVGAGVVIATVD